VVPRSRPEKIYSVVPLALGPVLHVRGFGACVCPYPCAYSSWRVRVSAKRNKRYQAESIMYTCKTSHHPRVQHSWGHARARNSRTLAPHRTGGTPQTMDPAPSARTRSQLLRPVRVDELLEAREVRDLVRAGGNGPARGVRIVVAFLVLGEARAQRLELTPAHVTTDVTHARARVNRWPPRTEVVPAGSSSKAPTGTPSAPP
jgi:hypothetical protein